MRLAKVGGEGLVQSTAAWAITRIFRGGDFWRLHISLHKYIRCDGNGSLIKTLPMDACMFVPLNQLL